VQGLGWAADGCSAAVVLFGTPVHKLQYQPTPAQQPGGCDQQQLALYNRNSPPHINAAGKQRTRMVPRGMSLVASPSSTVPGSSRYRSASSSPHSSLRYWAMKGICRTEQDRAKAGEWCLLLVRTCGRAADLGTPAAGAEQMPYYLHRCAGACGYLLPSLIPQAAKSGTTWNTLLLHPPPRACCTRGSAPTQCWCAAPPAAAQQVHNSRRVSRQP